MDTHTHTHARTHTHTRQAHQHLQTKQLAISRSQVCATPGLKIRRIHAYISECKCYICVLLNFNSVFYWSIVLYIAISPVLPTNIHETLKILLYSVKIPWLMQLSMLPNAKVYLQVVCIYIRPITCVLCIVPIL